MNSHTPSPSTSTSSGSDYSFTPPPGSVIFHDNNPYDLLDHQHHQLIPRPQNTTISRSISCLPPFFEDRYRSIPYLREAGGTTMTKNRSSFSNSLNVSSSSSSSRVLSNKRPLLSCSVCSASTHYSFYGAIVCDPCRTFFRRQVLSGRVRIIRMKHEIGFLETDHVIAYLCFTIFI